MPVSSRELRVSIVVPARNEARNLERVLPELPSNHEVIVVDGHSSDDTFEVVARVAPHARVIQQTRRGKGNALVCGFEAATGDVIVMFDADGSADPAEIDAFVQAIADGADFAKGSRVLGGSEDLTLVRSLGNRVLTLLTNLAFGTRYTDLCYGYNAFRRSVLPALSLPSSTGYIPQWGDGFEIETLLNCRVAICEFRVTEVSSVERSRIFGESNLNTVKDGTRVLKTIAAERRILNIVRQYSTSGVVRRPTPAPRASSAVEPYGQPVVDLRDAELDARLDAQLDAQLDARISEPVDGDAALERA